MVNLGGVQFVFTGQLASLSRNEAVAAVREAGGEVAGALSQMTDYLVAGPEGVLSKRKQSQAEIVGAKIIGEDEFLALIGLTAT